VAPAERKRTPPPRPPARERAVALLARRPYGEAELGRRLAAEGHGGEEIERALAELRRWGLLDDRRLAEHFILARAERLGHGPGRLLADLQRRGVAGDVAREVLEELCRRGDLDPDALLRRAIRRRGAGDERAKARMYNALLRAGFDETSIRRELGANDDDFA
jgi:regulatory protein